MNNHFYLFKLDSLHSLPFRRVNKFSKISVILAATIVDKITGNMGRKWTKTMKQVEETSTCLFELKESICYYCYSQREKDIAIRLEVSLIEEFL